jgi:putative DNA primase/helicase
MNNEVGLSEKQRDTLLYSSENDFGHYQCLYEIYGYLFKEIDLTSTLLVYEKYWTPYQAKDKLQQCVIETLKLRAKLVISELSKLNSILYSQNLDDNNKRELKDKISKLNSLLANCEITTNRINNITIFFLKETRINIKEEVFEANELDTLFNTTSGIINLKTGELLPHSSSYMINYMIDIPYEQNKAYDYSLWEKQLSELIKHYDVPEVKNFIKVLLGYLLIGGNREKKSLFLTGEKDSGKSLFINILDKLFDELFFKLPFNSISRDRSKNNDQGFDLAESRFKRVVAVSEPDRNATYNAALIKDISGREKITAAKKNKQPILIKPKFKLVIASNFEIIGDVLDPAFFNRFIIIPVFKGYSVIDFDREDKLISEIEGILHWFVEGAIEYFSLGRLPDIPQVLVDALNEMVAKQDTIGHFLTEYNYTITKDRNDLVLFSKLYEEYEDWCLENCEQPRYKREFTQYFVQKGCINTKSYINGKQARCLSNLQDR